MVDLFSDDTLDIPCPQCGETITKRIADMKRVPKFPCPMGCGGAVDATEFVASLKDVEGGLNNLGGSIKDIDIEF